MCNKLLDITESHNSGITINISKYYKRSFYLTAVICRRTLTGVEL